MAIRTAQPLRLILCEGPEDRPYMEALCAALFAASRGAHIPKPSIRSAHGGCQWQVVKAAQDKLKAVPDPRNTAFVMVDADRDNNAQECSKAEKLVRDFPKKYGRVTLKKPEPCFEAFILALHRIKVADCCEDNKKALKDLCAKLHARPGTAVGLRPLFTVEILSTAPPHPVFDALLTWLELPRLDVKT